MSYLLTIHCRFWLMSLLLLLGVQTIGQPKKSPVSILNAKGDTMYSDKSNAVAVVADKNIKEKLVITISQGRIYSSDKQLYTVDSLQNGIVTVTAFKVEKGKRTLLERKKYIVITSNEQLKWEKHKIDPAINLSGYNKGDIPVSIVRTLKKIEINSSYKIISCVVYISSSKGFNDPYIVFLTSEFFTEDLQKVLSWATGNMLIVIDEVKFKDNSGNIFKYPKTIGFSVVDDRK